jgi:hypothetical protein
VTKTQSLYNLTMQVQVVRITESTCKRFTSGLRIPKRVRTLRIRMNTHEYARIRTNTHEYARTRRENPQAATDKRNLEDPKPALHRLLHRMLLKHMLQAVYLGIPRTFIVLQAADGSSNLRYTYLSAYPARLCSDNLQSHFV